MPVVIACGFCAINWFILIKASRYAQSRAKLCLAGLLISAAFISIGNAISIGIKPGPVVVDPKGSFPLANGKNGVLTEFKVTNTTDKILYGVWVEVEAKGTPLYIPYEETFQPLIHVRPEAKADEPGNFNKMAFVMLSTDAAKRPRYLLEIMMMQPHEILSGWITGLLQNTRSSGRLHPIFHEYTIRDTKPLYIDQDPPFAGHLLAAPPFEVSLNSNLRPPVKK